MDTALPPVKSVRDLGVITNKKLNSQGHINCIYTIALKVLDMIQCFPEHYACIITFKILYFILDTFFSRGFFLHLQNKCSYVHDWKSSVFFFSAILTTLEKCGNINELVFLFKIVNGHINTPQLLERKCSWTRMILEKWTFMPSFYKSKLN